MTIPFLVTLSAGAMLVSRPVAAKPGVPSVAWQSSKADLDTQTDLATRFDVKTPPMIVFLDKKIEKVSSLLGHNDVPAMIKAMQSAAH